MAPPVDWNLSLAYLMVRQRDHALTDRQRHLQYQQEKLAKQLGELNAKITKLADAIAIVEKAGGDSANLRVQNADAHAEVQRIQPRYMYLCEATALIAANLRLLDTAHNSLHWLNFENRKLADFDAKPEVMLT